MFAAVLYVYAYFLQQILPYEFVCKFICVGVIMIESGRRALDRVFTRG